MDLTAEDRSGRHAPQAMPKDEALRRARTIKRSFFWAALVGFVVLWQAAAHHVVGVTSRTTTTTTSQNQGQNSGGFVPSSPSPGFGFGSGGNSQPLTQTSVS